MATDNEMENAETWDLENAEVRPPVSGRRSVVSVAFPPADLSRVARAARAKGLKLSEFIREAAIEKASPEGSAAFSQAIFWVDSVTRKEDVLIHETVFPSQTVASSVVKDWDLQIV